jgi:ABC transport system ATP-binding/permease protein
MLALERVMFQILVHDTEGRRSTRAFDQAEVSVGRADNNDVVLAHPSVSKIHAHLSCDEEGFCVRDAGSTNGVWLRGERVPAAGTRFFPGEILTVGDFSLAVLLLEERPPDTFRLCITAPGGEHHVFVLRAGEATVGSGEGIDLLLEGEGVAPRHARLVVSDERLVLADLRSATGTFLNGERLTAPQVLRRDDVVRIGCFGLTFSRPGEPAPLPARSMARPEDERTLPTAESGERSAATSKVSHDDHEP